MVLPNSAALELARNLVFFGDEESRKLRRGVHMSMKWNSRILVMFFLLGIVGVLAGEPSITGGNAACEERQKLRGIHTTISDPPLGATAAEFAILSYDPSYINELVYKYSIQAQVGETLEFGARGTGGSDGLVFDWIVFRSSDGVIEHSLQGAGGFLGASVISTT